jgi:7-cyano-7-deazaguanine synthase in queuosine biosynthesis
MKLIYNDRVATYTYDDQEVSIYLADGTIGVAVSGGLDSAALAYLICRYITDLKLEDKIKVIPVHSVAKQLSNSLSIAQSIVEDLYKEYPNINISDLEVFFYDMDNIATSEKTKAHSIFYKSLYDKYKDFVLTTALTALPSKDIIESWPVGYHDIRRVDSARDVNQYRDNGVYEYKPFININKKMIASLHEFLNIDKEYITKTWTCTSLDKYKNTKNFTKPCGICYHCWEKKWAFGQF